MTDTLETELLQAVRDLAEKRCPNSFEEQTGYTLGFLRGCLRDILRKCQTPELVAALKAEIVLVRNLSES